MSDKKQQRLQTQLDFINSFAEAKRDEIISIAEAESEKEKNAIIERERERIEIEYEKKIKQTEVKQRIQHSQELSQSRLQLLKTEDALLQSLMIDARNKLYEIRESEQYKVLIKQLIFEGIKILKDSNITIRCIQKDVSIVKQIIEDIMKENKKIKIDLDELFCLEDKVIGGVSIATMGDSIICNNTLEHRLNQALVVALPLIRKTVFPSLGNRETVQ